MYFYFFFLPSAFFCEPKLYWKQRTAAACSHLRSGQSHHLEDVGLFRVSFHKINMRMSENQRLSAYLIRPASLAVGFLSSTACLFKAP